MLHRLLAAFVCFLALGGACFAQSRPSPLEIFNSDEWQQRAQMEVLRLPDHAAATLLEYFVECTNSLSEHELLRAACERASTRWRLDGLSWAGEALRRVIAAQQLIQMSIRSKRATTKADTDQISRWVNNNSELEDAVATRMMALRRDQERK